MSGGIAHASFGGIGFGYLAGFEPIWGGLFFAVGSSILISRLSKNTKMKADTMTGILWSFGMALGILFIALAPGYMPDMTSYLFGDILSVSNNSLIFMAIFTVVIVITFLMLYNHLIMYLFDEEYARARGINTTLLEWIVYIMIPIGIIVLIKVVGIILTIALMTIPVSIAKLFCKSINKVIILAAALSAAFSVIGLVLSYYLNIPSGACIIIFSTLVYLIILMVKHRIQKRLHEQRVHGDD
jgi:zinc transport system permease protein